MYITHVAIRTIVITAGSRRDRLTDRPTVSHFIYYYYTSDFNAFASVFWNVLHDAFQATNVFRVYSVC